MKRISDAINHFLKSIWCWILNVVLPNHSKRSFFITTVYLNMASIHEFKKETLTKLNEAMTLAEDDNVLTLPALLFQIGLVGHEKSLSQYSTEILQHQAEEEYLRGICKAVLEATPKWMLYGRRDDMFNDLLGMFKLLPSSTETI